MTAPLNVTVDLQLDPHGAVEHTMTFADRPGESATKCVEQALLSAADFSPADSRTRVPIRVELLPASSDPEP